MVTINCSSVNFQDAVEVIPVAQSFILPVPKLTQGCVPLVYPTMDKKSGEPLLDSNGKALEGEGLVFYNEKNKTWQGVPTDGTGVIVFNNVTPVQAKSLLKRILNISKNNPENLKASDIKVLLKYAHSSAVAIKDVVPSDTKAVDNEMTMMSYLETGYHRLGMFSKNAVEPSLAVRYVGEVTIQSQAGQQAYSDGCMVIKHPNGKYDSMAPAAFLKSFTRRDGSPLGRQAIKLNLTPSQSAQLPYLQKRSYDLMKSASKGA